MDCCSTDIIEARFDDRYVKKKLAKYRKKGPKKTTSILAQAIAEQLRDGMTLLDIGGGIGDLQHLLLTRGISESINCEASSAFIEACMQEATVHGYADRITHIQGDFVELSKKVPKADIVTLDRVICCYPDMPELVQASLEKAGALYGIVIPSDIRLVKWVTSLYYNLRFLLQRNPFRVYVHPVGVIEELIQSFGFQRVFSQKSGTWLIFLFAQQVDNKPVI
jgi:magnesium-protoporphyrin O-methyltransferase